MSWVGRCTGGDAALQGEGTALLEAPIQALDMKVCHGILRHVPAGVLKDGERDSRDDHILLQGHCRCHQLAHEDSRLPMRAEDRALSCLVLQLRALQ